MRVAYLLLIAFLITFTLCHKYDNVDRLQIGIKHRPEKCDKKAEDGDTLEVHYTGMLTDGTVFDSSKERDPFKFTLGRGQVIQGWDRGLLGACAGEKRKLVIPSHMGYGDTGSPPKIPGKAVLIFEVEVVKVN